ncbi:MAG: adventurous gliding motility protein R [Bdellovibrionales bacterium RIFCSPHIGHO2_01_FULL_40_29]|nr:MAG: adventurous gliding motility protein R [Bdellovibrionales bacterium RIFCSPHIGHO2_01_FULL_40_29]OFZ32749.1 MAG: adventurous gliding motility protein R [Bdellovibrionales bacterium RIFCSPHIGHO2_02_FULL_40_15]
MAFFNFMNNSGVVGWTILLTGIAAIALIVERARTLYFDFGMNVDEFTNKIQTLVLGKKNEEAIIACAQLENKPLARAFKLILEKSDRDDETIFQAQDIAMAETVPMYTKRLHYLSMLANVSTLLGLLGTIHGLILSFQAVAQADPAEKQAMLASGIAVSMYTTALGLAVAIPAMVAFSFLTSRQNELLEQMTEKCSKLTEILTSSHIPGLNKNTVFPEVSRMNTNGPTPPSVSSKVS